MAQYYLDNITGGGDWGIETANNTGRVTGATYTVLSGAIYMSGDRAIGDGIYRASGQSATSAQKVTTVCRYMGFSGAWKGSGVLARVTDSSNYYRALIRPDNPVGAIGVELHKNVAGVLTQLGSTVSITTTKVVGTEYKLDLECVGSTIRVLVDDVERISVTDTSHTGIGYPGLIVHGFTNDGIALTYAEANDVAASDTQAPNVPTVSLSSSTATNITFSWSAVSDNGGGAVAGYNVRVLDANDQVLSGPTDIGNVLSYTVSGLTHPTTRKLQVNAYDNASPANTSAWSTAASGSTTQRKFEFTLNQVDNAGVVTVAANKTGLWWAWWPSITEVRTTTAAASGTGATTNASGLFSVNAPSSVSVGTNQGFIVISTQDAVPDSSEQVFAGPIDVV